MNHYIEDNNVRFPAVTLTIPMPNVGQTVVLVEDYHIDGGKPVPKGTKGMVIKSEQPDHKQVEKIWVEVQGDFPQLDNNIISFYDIGDGTCGEVHNGFRWRPAMEFHRACQYTGSVVGPRTPGTIEVSPQDALGMSNWPGNVQPLEMQALDLSEQLRLEQDARIATLPEFIRPFANQYLDNLLSLGSLITKIGLHWADRVIEVGMSSKLPGLHVIEDSKQIRTLKGLD